MSTLYSAASVNVENEYSFVKVIDNNMSGDDVRIGNEEFALFYRLPIDELRDYFHFRVFKLEANATGDIVFKIDSLDEVKLDEYNFIARP